VHATMSSPPLKQPRTLRYVPSPMLSSNISDMSVPLLQTLAASESKLTAAQAAHAAHAAERADAVSAHSHEDAVHERAEEIKAAARQAHVDHLQESLAREAAAAERRAAHLADVATNAHVSDHANARS
jgi:hypothetical protein